MTPETRLQEAREAIRRIIADIARLAQTNLPRQEFFRHFIERTVRAMDAAGGAVWIGRQGRFNLIADVDFESSQFAGSALQRDGIRAALRWVEEHRRPLLIAPLGPQESGDDPAPSGIPNVTPMAFFYIPLNVADRVVGVVQVWQRPGRDPRHFRTFTELLLGVASHAESYLESRQLETAFRDTERLEQLLLVTERMLSAERPQALAEQVVNLGRDTAGADRLSMLICRGRGLSVAAVSALPRIDHRHPLMRALVTLGGSVCAKGKAQAWRREQLKSAPPAPALDRFFEQTTADLIILMPLLHKGVTIGVLAAEYRTDATPVDQDAAVLEALARQVAPALAMVQERAMGLSGRLASRLAGRRLMVGLTMTVVMVMLLSVIRLPTRLEGRCTVWPVDRAAVASLEPGRVVEVYVRQGQVVRADEPLLRVENPVLAELLGQAERDLEKWQAEDQRLEAAGDAVGRRIAQIRAAQAQREVESVSTRQQTQIVRAPQAGVVVTADVAHLVGAVVGPGDRVVEIADLGRWEVVVELPEQDVPALEAALEQAGDKGLAVNFVLSSRPDEPLVARLVDIGQVSPVARPAGSGNVVLLRAVVESDDARRGELRIAYQGRARIMGPEKSLLKMGLDPLFNRIRMAWF